MAIIDFGEKINDWIISHDSLFNVNNFFQIVDEFCIILGGDL